MIADPANPGAMPASNHSGEPSLPSITGPRPDSSAAPVQPSLDDANLSQPRAAISTSTAELLRHWLFFIAVMAVIFCVGWIIAP